MDTHTFIWWVSSPEKLSENALAAYENRENSLFLSFASIWEMQIKVQIGKLRLPLHLKELVEEQKSVNDLRILPISLSHIYRLENLPIHHKDPFDRMLISQSIEENLLLVSKDSVFADYEVNVLW
ncbi:MAG: type II toxin-antitoxin system VapC family toxin [Desulfococcaceae bacterium]|nr:type II toxin-antitoxin system VapC family toxin [Desulfococcaceae bacterium]